jgi:hypothetical protein
MDALPDASERPHIDATMAHIATKSLLRDSPSSLFPGQIVCSIPACVSLSG